MSTLPKGIACFVIGLLFLPLNAQEQITPASQKATQVHELGYQSMPSIASKLQNGTAILIEGPQPTRELNPKMRYVNQVVPGKGSKGPDLLADKQRQAEQKPLRSVSTSFDTMTSSGFAPSDPSGAVGADYFIASWNVAFQIYAKDGTPATPVLSPETIFGNGKDDGDQIVLYDAAADRYIITQFDGAGGTPPNGFMVAVSQTNDPVNGGWHVYNTSDFGTPAFPDYTKFSIWSDGYYVTANTSLATSEQVWALERDQMLVGAPAQIIGFPLTGIQTAGFYSPQAFNVSDGNLPANGNATIVYMQDDAWAGVTDDHLKLWTVNVDWTTPSNSTISSPVRALW